MRTRLVVSLLFVLGSNTSAQQTSGWLEKFPTANPPARVYSCMTYDGSRHTVVLFGGLQGAGGNYFNDTWTWDGATWAQASPAQSPEPRSMASMAYDGSRNGVVLFGGYVGYGVWFGPLNDTWIWDGSTWSQQFPAISPPARYASHIAYDEVRHEVVVFGGYTSGATISDEILGDTWVWNGVSWNQKTPSAAPPKRAYGTMTYDAARRNIVLFGGVGLNSSDQQVYLNDTWVWDGTTWIQQSPSVAPPPNAGMTMAYYDRQKAVLMFGGWANSSTWTWDGRNWTNEQPSAGPSSRWVAPVASDTRNKEVVLFGGGVYINGADTGLYDTWVWTRVKK